MNNYFKDSIDFPIGNDTLKYKENAIALNGVKEASRFENVLNKNSTFTPSISISLTDGKYYCRSIFVKPNSLNSTIVAFVVNSSNNSLDRWVTFNIETKTITYSHPTSPDCFANYQQYENGWIRFWVTALKTSSVSIDTVYFIGANGSSSLKHSFWAWGAQFEEVFSLASGPSDYEEVGPSTKKLFYNRDSNVNVDASITSLTYLPSYGSRVTFSSNLNKYETSDGYYNLIPLSINNLKAKFDLRYDLNETEAQKLVHFIENKNGVYDITFTDPSFLYKNIDGFCSEYAINHINKNHYEVALSLEVNDCANLFNWKNMNFINPDYKTWDRNKIYNKYDVLFENDFSESNLFTNSEDFFAKHWYNFGCDIVFDRNQVNVGNSLGSFYLQTDESQNIHGITSVPYQNANTKYDQQLKFISSSEENITLSFFVKHKAGNGRFVMGIEFSPDDKETSTRNYIYYSFNLLNKTNEKWGSNNATALIEAYPNNWYRCSITAPRLTNWYSFSLQFINNAGSNEYNALDQGVQSMYIWGAQLQAGLLTNYIKTDSFPYQNNKLNNFYYCLYRHNSKLGLDTTTQDSASPWSQDFFFEPDITIQNTVNLKVSKLNFKNSFTQNIKTQKNIATLDLTYKFSNITTQKARAILHFLENKGGYRRFRVNMNSVYNKPKVFYAPSWTHTWKYENSHDIEVQLIEDPMGVIPKD